MKKDAVSVNRRKLFKNLKRVVVKIGTNLFVGKAAAENKVWLMRIVSEIAALRKKGIEVVIVSSGAIGAGMHLLGIEKRPQLLPLQQACAAVGQNQIMQLYERLFRRHDIPVAQVLITANGLTDRQRYFNLRNTMNTLLELGVVPIINENDSVSVDEIRLGDNDTLSAHVTNFVEAELLVILTDIDGLYDGDPKNNANVKLIRDVRKITPRIRNYCGKKGSETSVGGMHTKLAAAEIVMRSGEMMLLANGKKELLHKLIEGKNSGTLFHPDEKGLSSHKRWIAFTRKTVGIIQVDAGGAEALQKKNKSLLPVGIKKVQGNFHKGDIVAIYNSRNRKIGRGITNYSSREIAMIMGRKTAEIETVLGRRDYEEVIHRDNLVLK